MDRLLEEAEDKDKEKVVVPVSERDLKKTLKWLGRDSSSDVISKYRKSGVVE